MWKAVSKTATLPTWGKIFLKALYPTRWAPLWSGASGIKLSILLSVSPASSKIAESSKYLPPWTIRWPTPLISSKDLTIPSLTKASTNKLTALAWSRIGRISSLVLPSNLLILKIASSWPILSAIPDVITFSSGISKSLNFKLELPALTLIILNIN